MRKSFKVGDIRERIAGVRLTRDPHFVARVVLGTLLAANIVMAIVAFRPWAETPQQLEAQLTSLRQQQIQRGADIARLKLLVSKSEKARSEGEQFIGKYFLGRRSASSAMIQELVGIASATKIRSKEHAFAFEPVEGSDTLSMMTITGNYEGSYADLIQYVNRLDRSPRLFIVESLTATPQQGNTGVLNISAKVNVFVRDDNTVPAATPTSADQPKPADQPKQTAEVRR